MDACPFRFEKAFCHWHFSSLNIKHLSLFWTQPVFYQLYSQNLKQIQSREFGDWCGGGRKIECIGRDHRKKRAKVFLSGLVHQWLPIEKASDILLWKYHLSSLFKRLSCRSAADRRLYGTHYHFCIGWWGQCCVCARPLPGSIKIMDKWKRIGMEQQLDISSCFLRPPSYIGFGDCFEAPLGLI